MHKIILIALIFSLTACSPNLVVKPDDKKSDGYNPYTWSEDDFDKAVKKDLESFGR